jgi:cardiolipin synthase (CMP-forming)
MIYIYKGENILNLSNMISLYRLLAIPLIFGFIIAGNEKRYAIFLFVSLISDIIEGNIARFYKLRTRFGAALNNIADLGTYAMALLGLFIFKWSDLKPHALVLYIFLTFFMISYLIAFFRIGKIPGMHLYGAVIAGYLQGIFFFVLFAWDFYAWLYYLSVIMGIMAYAEKIIILLVIDDIRPEVKGLYWLIRSDNTRQY